MILDVKLSQLKSQAAQIQKQQHDDLVAVSLERYEVRQEIESLKEKKDKEEESLKDIEQSYEKFKHLIKRTPYGIKRRENNQTNVELIQSNNTTRYRRRNETKQLLEFIHGGEEGAVFGAWDFLTKFCTEDKLETLMLNFKRGKFLQKIYDNVTDNGSNDERLTKAIATKYLGHLSRRKYVLICKIQESSFKGEKIDDLLPKNEEFQLDLRSKQLSHYSVEKFVKSLDIGDIHQMPGCTGITRTVTALVTMIADVNLKVKANKSNLIWFNKIENHFIVEFSDDGAPESKEGTMTVGSLTLWNFENRIRSRDYHYPLHLLSVDEKNAICVNLWAQHSDEMLLIEGNIFKIDSKKVTFEFQPSADMSWQCWAANVLPSSATYPSPYANVHKSQLAIIGGSIGYGDESTWKPPTEESRKTELSKLEKFRSKLPLQLNEKAKHEKELQFMADEGCHQLGEPTIGIFANRYIYVWVL